MARLGDIPFYKRLMIIFLSVLIVVGVCFFLFSKQEKIGHHARGARLQRMEAAPNFNDGVFSNVEHTPTFGQGEHIFSVMRKFLFHRSSRAKPASAIPHVTTDLFHLPADSNLMVWFGHSSYYLQLDGKRILVDPVFSGTASPINHIKAFAGSDCYQVEDIPCIDVLLITHDHWDHLDYQTIRKLEPKVKEVVTGLGVGAHLEGWGYAPGKIHELYWGEAIQLSGLQISSCTARHFSGRWLQRNSSLWSSFAVRGQHLNLYLGGDSGYGRHFKEIGDRLGPFDWAVLENGQYSANWQYTHMFPKEYVRAARDLRARKTIPVHSSKFVLALHAWDEPLREVTRHGAEAGLPVLTPRIGEVVYLDQSQTFEPWWEGLE